MENSSHVEQAFSVGRTDDMEANDGEIRDRVDSATSSEELQSNKSSDEFCEKSCDESESGVNEQEEPCAASLVHISNPWMSLDLSCITILTDEEKANSEVKCLFCEGPFAEEETAFKSACERVFHDCCLKEKLANSGLCDDCRAKFLESSDDGESTDEASEPDSSDSEYNSDDGEI